MNFDLVHEYTEKAETEMRTGLGQYHNASFERDTISFCDTNLYDFVNNHNEK